MKLASLALIASLLLPSTAFADERAQLTDQIVATSPLPCTSAALSLFTHQALERAINKNLDALRNALKYDERWSPGNANYDALRGLLIQAMDEDTREHGPFLSITVESMIKEASKSWSLDELRSLSTYFHKPEGQIYWEEILDGSFCFGVLQALEQPPFYPLQGAQKDNRDRLMASLAGAKARFITRASKLSPAQRNSLDKTNKLMGEALIRAVFKLALVDDAFQARMKEANRPYASKFAEIYKAYKPE